MPYKKIFKKGIIFDIKRLSTEDGPGLRDVIFLKGCSLRCIWCHNPESQNIKPELLFYESKCVKCGRCVDVCPNSVHEINSIGKRIIHREKCKMCGYCIDNCFYNALAICGESVTSRELLNEIKKETIYFNNSNGGVTFSGGEPTYQMPFLVEMLKLCKKENIHTALDTCGYFDYRLIKKYLDYIDLFLYDIKIMDPNKHFKFTGVSNKLILSNLEKLAKARKNIFITIPIIPKITDSISNIKRIFIFAKKNNIRKIRIIPYNNIADSKYAWIGREYKLKGTKDLKKEYYEKITNLGKEIGLFVEIV